MTNSSLPKNAADAFTAFAALARALGHAHRLILLEHIAQGERSVERLAELADMSVANASQHLQALKRSGFVTTRRDGKRVMYRLGSGPIIELLSALQTYGEHHHGALRDALLGGNSGQELEAIDRAELVSRLKAKDIVLLDVRPRDEYDQGHLPGATNIPLEELVARISELPKDQDIIAYCRGPYCTLSVKAVAALHAAGYHAERLMDGFPNWKAAGLAVETA
jgi:ArsR family transcriptional regulator